MKRKLLVTCAALLVAGALPACSTILDGQIQDVTIETLGTEGALCYMKNQDFNFRFYPPQTIPVTKSVYPYTIQCLAPGNREKTIVVEPKIADSAFFNAATGVVPGVAVDHVSAAMYELPDGIVIDFTNMPPKPYDLPAYQKLYDAHPELKGMEEFRAGKPALMRDAYDPVPTLAPRESRASDDFVVGTEAGESPIESMPSDNAGSSNDSAPSSSIYSGSDSTADGLTRQMNPQVFGRRP